MQVTVLGCGSMATGILTGWLEGLHKDNQPIPHITACVRSEKSVERLRQTFQRYSESIYPTINGNVEAAASSDVVVLGHKPYQVQKVLGENGMAEALRGKMIISILAGVTTDQIRGALVAKGLDGDRDNTHFDIIRVMPNIGARLRESMTLISDPHNVSADLLNLTKGLFGRIGRVVEVTEATFDTGTVLTGACYALTTIALEGLIDGAVLEGLPRPIALEIAAQCFRGLTMMLQQGEHPAMVRESISSPGGATITGIVELERHSVRSAFSDAIIKATTHTKTMAQRQD
ncbi:pyrroline-5-carboxylate reductase dimerization-domain-containing protein [Annulohypoxylon moriforme]|nr:pyrroline-5-carboxylate reductase dimerization-domain-containing protein [Annulohypoxylon moriforme]